MNLSLDFVSELRRHFKGDIRLDKTSRILYSTDASIYQIEPLGVVIPRDQYDLIAAVELASKYKIPVLPRGSGSSLAGQAIGQALILDCSRYLDKIPKGINPETHTAIVEPGVILSTLNRAAAEYGLMFGPDPASAERATMGGVIGNNATGAHSILYGLTADHILSADIILADGSLATWGLVNDKGAGMGGRQSEIIASAFEIREKFANDIKKDWPKTWRNSAGYRLNYLLPWSATRPDQWVGNNYPPTNTPSAFNLATLLAGSEGTLAVIRSATVNLVPKPKNTILGVLAYPGIAEACDSVPDLLRLNPSAVELIPQMLIQLARSVPVYAGQLGFVQGTPAALLVIEFSGDDKNHLREKAKALRQDVVIADSVLEQSRVWAVRKVGLGIFDSRPSDTRPVAFIEDCAIPVEKLGEFVREVERLLSEYGTHAAFYAHASAGCLHIRPILNLKTSRGVQNLRLIAQEVLLLTLRLGGSMSSEHGDGLVRSEWLRQTYGDRIFEAMTLIKQAADPDSLLNPGKMNSAPPMDENLRYGADYQTDPWKPSFDFARAGGFSTAIEQCNGQGVCRKLDGVMCPSFQATREEMHSTRGRANLLRALISIDANRLPEEQVKQALDLCLACKGCKAECPSGVDMAKLKYEFQSHYYESHHRPLRDYLFGYIGLFAKLGSPLGRLVNWFTDIAYIRRIADRLFGISEKRVLPKFGWTGNNQNKLSFFPGNPISDKKFIENCLFLPDTFTHFFEPEIERSARDVLALCGIKVITLPVFGAGRTLLSKGFIKPARNHAINLLNQIRRADPTGSLAVIGLEPSEIYTLRDEMMDLLPERGSEIEALMARSWLIDEYLVRKSPESQKIRIANIGLSTGNNGHTKVLLHAHCYQKAQAPHPDGFPIGVSASTELLRAVGYDVEVLKTGCCGMAGAFGYETEHFDVSMRVGELKLFPEVRQGAASGQFNLAAIGTSCRSQIIDGTGVKAEHSIVLVAQKLKALSRI
jgi:FAD/FMN-containing dehydrogenase/Fe-S oxidoreductase